MSQSIGDFLPLAVGIAISPIPIIGVILALFSARARSNGVAFAVGWVGALVAVSVVVLVVGQSLDIGSEGSSSGRAWLHIGLGVLLVLMAHRYRRKRSADSDEVHLPKWMSRVEGMKPIQSLGLGAALVALNPKNVILAIAASVQIAQANLKTGGDIVSITVFTFIASITILAPVVWVVIAGDRATTTLEGLKSWFIKHNDAIMVVLLLALGALLIGKGIAGL